MKSKVKKYILLILFLSFGLGIISYYIVDSFSYKYKNETLFLFNDYYDKQNILKYVDLGENNGLKKNVAEDLNIKEQNFSVKINYLEGSEFIKIEVNGKSSNEVMAISQKFSDQYLELLNNYFDNLNQDIIIKQPVKIENVFPMLIGVITGLIILVVSLRTIVIYGRNKKKIRNCEDVNEFLDLMNFGLIPKYEHNKSNEAYFNLNTPPVIILKEQNSLVSESYKMIRAHINFLKYKAITITSTTSGEGKSSTIINLACSFASIGKKVIIVDGDLRNPTIHSKLKLNRARGLTDILLYERAYEYNDFIQTLGITEGSSLDILTSGSKVENPSELLSKDNFKLLLEILKKDYDIILIDTPPTALIPDAKIISSLTNGTIYIIEYNKYYSSNIKSFLESYRNFNLNILGTIITKVNYHKEKKLKFLAQKYRKKNYL